MSGSLRYAASRPDTKDMRKALVSVCLGADSTAVTVPTLVAQVHDDTMTRPQDVQDIYDAIPVSDKELYWIEGTDRRFDGYNFFGIHPEVPIDWFDAHMK